MASTGPKPISEVFAPATRTCPNCGRESQTNQATCPHCGAWYAAVRPKRSRRKIGAALAVLALLIGVGALLASSPIDRSKDRAAERDARETTARQAAERKRLRVEQRPRSAPLGTAEPLSALAGAVQADAKARVADGTLRGPVQEAECEPYPDTEARRLQELAQPSGRRGYLCEVVTTTIRATDQNPEGGLAYPFLAVIDYDAGRMTWCKANPPPGEKAIPGSTGVVPLSPRCLAG
jgi:hypothetical protein